MKPRFATLEKYMAKGLDLSDMGKYMNENYGGNLTDEKIKAVRKIWKGKLVVKGIASLEDAERAIKSGVDGLWISNHGGR